MTKEDKWTPETAAEMIQKNGGRVGSGRIFCKSPGLKVLSAIDYLVNHHKLIWIKEGK